MSFPQYPVLWTREDVPVEIIKLLDPNDSWILRVPKKWKNYLSLKEEEWISIAREVVVYHDQSLIAWGDELCMLEIFSPILG